MNESLFNRARLCLLEPGVEATLALTEETVTRIRNTGSINLEDDATVDVDLEPVFPRRPQRVDPGRLPRRGTGTVNGRAALIHAIAHIEYNAVHLAWDVIYRFRDLPAAFYLDWMNIALEECRHFRLLQQRLTDYGYEYGDFDAHDGLWQVARNTRHDPLLRMALVPRVLEARGLDVTPGMIRGLEAASDHETATILRIIYNEEIGHVETGTRWFRYLCEQQGCEPEAEFYRLVTIHYGDGPHGPYNEGARLKAGFTQSEIEWLKSHG